uniref:Uncharacterized protein n=1 Tax=Arundo donax TaxID=35708 RepID=A0A0A9D688_ARUDO
MGMHPVQDRYTVTANFKPAAGICLSFLATMIPISFANLANHRTSPRQRVACNIRSFQSSPVNNRIQCNSNKITFNRSVLCQPCNENIHWNAINRAVSLISVVCIHTELPHERVPSLDGLLDGLLRPVRLEVPPPHRSTAHPRLHGSRRGQQGA